MTASSVLAPGQMLFLPTPAPYNELLLRGQIGGLTHDRFSMEGLGLPSRGEGASAPGCGPVALYTTDREESFAMQNNGFISEDLFYTQRAVVGLGTLTAVMPTSRRDARLLRTQIHGDKPVVPPTGKQAQGFFDGGYFFSITDLTRLADPVPLSVLRKRNPGMDRFSNFQIIDGSLFNGAATYSAGSDELGTAGEGNPPYRNGVDIPRIRAQVADRIKNNHRQDDRLSLKVRFTVDGKKHTRTVRQLIAEIRRCSVLGNKLLTYLIDRSLRDILALQLRDGFGL